MTTKLEPQTALERNVARWVKARTTEYDGDMSGVFKDLCYDGCQSGMVGHLIYYKDTLAFYRKHRAEIDSMLADTMKELGEKSPADVFGDKWDTDDPLARDTHNQNLLAWFGFEETARKLADRAGIEV